MKSLLWLALLVCGVALGQNYPYSIHPYGVRTPEQFEAVRRQYPALCRVYGRLHTAQLRRDQHLYVSYLRGAVYWTRTPLLIHSREYVLTDGKRYVRGRCGNTLSALPMLPVEKLPPPARAFDLPVEAVNVDSSILPWTPSAALPPLTRGPIGAVAGVSGVAVDEIAVADRFDDAPPSVPETPAAADSDAPSTATPEPACLPVVGLVLIGVIICLDAKRRL